MSDTPLLDYIPPVMGSTFQEERDGPRLGAQYLRVRNLMADGKWRTLSAIAAATGDPQASISARLRDLRRGGFSVEKEYFNDGIWLYRALRIIPERDDSCSTSSSGAASAP